MHLLFATTNKGKIIEIKECLRDLPIDLKTIHDFPMIDPPQETGDTFEENALQKAQYFYDHAKLPTFADDSGIIVDALQNGLGIHTRRWGAGADASDYKWIQFFLKRMRSEANKHASFQCCIAYIDEQGQHHIFNGSCDGIITDELEADYLPGLPISACFKPDGYDKVYSALSIEEKNRISHRGKAMQEFVQFLNSKKDKAIYMSVKGSLDG